MNGEGTDQTAKSSRKRKMGTRIKWTTDMESEILEYSKAALVSGKGFEKPTANEFYRKFLATAQDPDFGNVTLEKIVQHMKSIKNAYHVALNWRNQTGQGILDSDPNAGALIKVELLKRCKQFDQVDEILGDKPQFNPPYVHHSEIDLQTSDSTSDPLATETDDLLDDEDEASRSITEDDNSTLSNVDVGNASFDDGKPPARNEVPTKQPDVVRHLSKKQRRSPIKCTVMALESAMTLRAEAEQRRLDWESKCREKEISDTKDNHDAQLAIEKDRLDFEKQKWQDEMRLKHESENRKFELGKFRIEKEAELAEKKMQREFGIEKLKLTKGSPG